MSEVLESHEFSSANVKTASFDYGYLNLNLLARANGLFFSREDVIAMAKAFEIKGSEL